MKNSKLEIIKTPNGYLCVKCHILDIPERIMALSLIAIFIIALVSIVPEIRKEIQHPTTSTCHE